jgi:hypothetical protein
MELLQPITPPKVRSQRVQEVTIIRRTLHRASRKFIELYNGSAQLWMSLQEDEKMQELERKEEGVNTVVQDLKQKKKAMKI